MEMHPILPIVHCLNLVQVNSTFLWLGHPWVLWRVGVGAGAGLGTPGLGTTGADPGTTGLGTTGLGTTGADVNPRTYISRGGAPFLPRLKEEYTPLQHPQSYRRISCNRLSS